MSGPRRHGGANNSMEHNPAYGGTPFHSALGIKNARFAAFFTARVPLISLPFACPMNNTIKIIIIFSFILIAIAWFSHPTIEIRKQVVKGFQLPEKVQINLKNDEDSSIDARGHMAMSFFINEAINAMGVEKSYDEKANVIIKCNYKYGLCLPYFGRHFDIHFTAISDVNIQILNQSSEVLAEAQFIGSWTRIPTSEIIAKMIGLIIQTEIHMPTSSINHEDINSVVVKYTTKN